MTLRPRQRVVLVVLSTGSVLLGLTGTVSPAAVAEQERRTTPAAVHGPWAPEGSFIGPTQLRGSQGVGSLHRHDGGEPLARKFK